MAIVWGAYVTASGGYGMRIGIDLSFSAVTHASASCTATYKIYTQNSGTWDPPDDQIMEFDGNYSLPEQVPFTNVGTTATKGDIILRTTKTYTFTYGPNMYGTTQLPQEADLIVDVIHTRPVYYPHCEVHVLFPIRPYAAPAVPTTIALARVSDTNNKITWVNKPTPGEPYDAVWLERYIYLGPGMVSATGVGSWTRIATLAKTVALYNDTAAIPNRKYTYRVQADNSVGTSAYVQSAIMYTTPDAPTSVARTITNGNQVLTWTLGVGYTEYETEVWRSVDGVYSLLTTLPTGISTYVDTTALTSQRVKYKLRTKTTGNPTVLYSVDSAETTETTGVPTAPAAPTNTKPATGTIDPTANTTHTWTHNPTDGSLQTYFEVQYRHVGDAVWKTSGKIASGTSSWVMPKNSVSKGNQVEWQVRTYGFSSTLASPWSASAKWMTTPAIPLKYPVYLDLDTGRFEADSKITLISEQTRRVATVTKTTVGTNSTAPYNILSFTIPTALARTGKKFRITAQCNLIADTIGAYTDLTLRIGVGATTGGTIIAASQVDHRVAGRSVGHTFVADYTFAPASAGGENINTINFVLVATPGAGGSYSSQASNRPGYLIIDEILEGSSTAGGSGGAGFPVGGADGTVLTKQSANDNDVAWEALPPIPPTLPAGGAAGTVLTKITAANNDANWVAPASGIGVVEPTYACTLRANAAQTMTTSVEVPITYDRTISTDPQNMWDGSSTVTVPKAGLYTITFQYCYAGTAAAGSRINLIKINGGTYRQWYAPFAPSQQVQGTLSFDVFLNAGDTVQARQFQSSGADLTTTTTQAYMPMLTVAKTPEFAPGGGSIVVDRPAYGNWYRSTNLTTANAVSIQIPFDSINYSDPVGMTMDPATGTVTVQDEGLYAITAHFSFMPNAAGNRYGWIYAGPGPNGTNIGRTMGSTSPVASAYSGMVLAHTRYLKAGEVIRVLAYQNSGGNLDLLGDAGNRNIGLEVTKIPSAYSGSAVSTYGERNYSAHRILTVTTAAFAISTATTLLWDTAQVDDGIPYANGVFTIPAAGYYEITATAIWDAAATTGYRQIRVLRNSSIVGAHNVSAANQNTSPIVTRTVLCAAGDTITVQGFSNVASSTILGSSSNNYVTITKVPAPVINGAAASGLWGAAPLDPATYGTNSLIGREVYIDSKGQLRVKPDQVELGGGVDLNTVTTTGTWTQSQSAEATSGTNYPIPVAGLLEVVGNGSSMVWQRYTGYPTHNTYGGRIYTRGYYNGTWDPWVEITNGRLGNWVDCQAETRWCTDVSSTANAGAAHSAKYFKIGKMVTLVFSGTVGTAAVANFAFLLPPSAGVPAGGATTYGGSPGIVGAAGQDVAGGSRILTDRIVFLTQSNAYTDSMAGWSVRHSFVYEVV